MRVPNERFRRFLGSTLLMGLLFVPLVGCTELMSADPAAESTRERTISELVAAMLPKYHVSQNPFDDSVSERALQSFLEKLDPGKLYWLQSDVDEFQRYSKSLDDLTQQGDLSPAREIHARLVIRMQQAATIVQNLLTDDFDFSIDETVQADVEQRPYAVSTDQLRDRWRRELKWRWLEMESQEQDGDSVANDSAANISERGTIRERLLANHLRTARRVRELTSDKLLEVYLTSISTMFDPHTTYMSPETVESFMIHMRANLEGIGAELQERGDYVYITRLIPGGSAAKSKEVAVGDRIMEVGEGIQGTWRSAHQLSVDDLAKQIRGAPGSYVRLRLRSDTNPPKTVTLQRSKVELTQQQARGEMITLVEKADDALRADGSLQVGYIELPGFYGGHERKAQSCSEDVQKLLIDFKQNQADAVVLDLRNNSGGILHEAVRLTGLFIDQGPIVQVKLPGGGVEVLNDPQSGVVWAGPLVVLTNKFSASASEIVAGALQNYGRAIVVGDAQTHGKGTVQQPIDISRQFFGDKLNRPNFGSLKISVQKFYLPDGDSTQCLGVTSQIVLPSITSVLAVGESELPNALECDQIQSVEHTNYELTPTKVLNQVIQRSRDRIAISPSFAQAVRDIEVLRQRNDRKEVSLQREKFLASKQALKQIANRDTLSSKSQAEFPGTDYDQEVLRILDDYVHGLRDAGKAVNG